MCVSFFSLTFGPENPNFAACPGQQEFFNMTCVSTCSRGATRNRTSGACGKPIVMPSLQVLNAVVLF